MQHKRQVYSIQSIPGSFIFVNYNLTGIADTFFYLMQLNQTYEIHSNDEILCKSFPLLEPIKKSTLFSQMHTVKDPCSSVCLAFLLCGFFAFKETEDDLHLSTSSEFCRYFGCTKGFF